MSTFKTIPSSPFRATCGLAAIIATGIGAGILWGAGGVFLVIGAGVWIDLSSDEALERLTLTKRGAFTPTEGTDK